MNTACHTFRPVTCPPTRPTVEVGATCNDVPASLEERIRRDPSICATIGARELVMHAPFGSLLMIDYTKADGTRGTYVGRLSRRQKREHGLVCEMVCLNRGAPGVGDYRSFSTKVGTIHSVSFLELPRPVEAG